MEIVSLVLRIIIALGILNVWILRFNKASSWRGGDATNMREEFAAYGLPLWFMKVVGALKLFLAACLIASIWFSFLTKPAAFGLVALMIGAVAMHVKVGDPLKKSLPALILLIGSLVVAFV